MDTSTGLNAMARPRHGLQRLLKACVYSWQGFRAGWRHETAFRDAVMLCAALTPLAFWVGRNALERALLLATLLVLLITELFNSAVEALADRIGTEHHELSGRAKDFGAAAGLLAVLLVAVVWGTVAWLRFGAAP